MPDWLEDAQRLDAAIFAAVAATETPALDSALRRLSRSADRGLLWIGTALVLALLGGRRGRRAARRGLLSLGLASALANLVAKPLAGRRRPDREALTAASPRHVRMPRSTSFPSGHAASALAFAGGAGRAWPACAVPVGGLASLVAYSRVHTGVHYPADVAAGALLGLAVAAALAADRSIRVP